MGILNHDGALYMATGIDNTGLYKGKQEAIGIVRTMMREITSFDVFAGIGISAASAFAKAAAGAFEFEKQFQSSMLEVSTISDEITQNLDEYKQKIIDLTTEEGIPVRANEAAKALYQIVSAGHDGADAMKILEVSARSAIGGITDTATSADAITSILNAYGKKAKDAESVSDMLFNTVKLGKTTIGELGKSISQVTSVAAAFDVEIEQVLAAVSTLTSSGTPTTIAMTQIRQAILAASKELGDGAFKTRTFQEGLREIVAKANGSEAALRALIPNVEAVNGILGLTGIKAQKAASDLESMQDAAGSTQVAFEKMRASAENQMKLLGNNIISELRPLGQKILKNVSEVAEKLNKAFENGDIEKILSTTNELLKVGAIAWGSYRVAILLNTIATQAYNRVAVMNIATKKTNIALTKANTRALISQAAAQLKANAAMMVNPYAAAAAGIMLLGYGLYRLIKYQTDAEKQQKKMNEAIEVEKTRLDALVDSFKRATEGSERYNQVKEEIRRNYGDYLNKMNLEVDALRTSKRAYELLSKEIEKNTRVKLRNQFIDEHNEQLGKSIGKDYSKLRKKLIKDLGAEKGKQIFQDIKSKIEEAGSDMTVQVGITDVLKEEKVSPIKWGKYGDIINSIRSSKYQLKNVLEEADDIFGDANNETQTTYEDIKERVKTTRKLISTLEKDIANLRSGKTQSSNIEADITAKQEQLKKAKETLETLTGIDSSSSKNAQSIVQTTQKLASGLLDVELSLSKERLAILKDGKAKRLEESKQEWKEQKAAIEKEISERKDKYKELGKTMPEEEKKLFQQRLDTADESKKTRDVSIEKEYAEQYKKQISDVTAIFLSEEEKKREAIKKRYEDERKWAKEALEGSSITQEEYDVFITAVNESEVHEQQKRLLAGLNDFKAKEQQIHEEWDNKIADAIALKDDALLQRLKEGKQKALGELNAQMLMQSDEWRKLFEDMDTMTSSQIQKLVDTIREKAKDLNLDPANLEAIMKRLREADNKIRQKNPFKTLIKAIKEYKKAEEDASKGDALRNIAREAGATLDLIADSFNSITDGLKQIGIAGDEETQKLLGCIGEMVGGAAQLAKGIASENPAEIIAGSVKLLTSAFEVFDSKTRGANRKIKQHAESVKKLQEEYAKLEQAIKKALGQEQYNKQLELNKNRQKQIAHIQEQIAEEQSKRKKKRDEAKINEWQNQILQLKNEIEDTTMNVLNDLLTTDIKSFADSLASAIVQGFDEGLSDLDSVVDKNINDLMKNIITKQFNIRVIQEQLKPLLKYAEEATKDGALSEEEIKRIQEIGKDAKGAIVTGWEQWSQIMKELGIDTENIKNGVTGELKAAMTEQTASQLVGLWNMTAMDLREIKEWLQNNPTTDIAKEINSLLHELNAINQNTRRTADNTEFLEIGFKKLEEKLQEIEKNTKPNKSRG